MIEPALTPESAQNGVLNPARASEPLLGSAAGQWIFESIFAALEKKTAAQAA